MIAPRHHRPSLIITAYLIWMAVTLVLIVFFILALHYSFRQKHRDQDGSRRKPDDRTGQGRG